MERQTAPILEGIRADHVNRYRWAVWHAPSPGRILDAPCGTGYGSHVLSCGGINTVFGFDISEKAIGFAKKFWSKHAQFSVGDMLEAPWEHWPDSEPFDAIVCLEGIEHLAAPEHALTAFHTALKDAGVLIVSTPNEAAYPFKPEEFEGEEFPHLRHYTMAELREMLGEAGFEITATGSQADKTGPVVDGEDGRTLIVAARKI